MDPLRTLCPKRFTGVSLVRSNALWEDDGLDDIEGDDDDSLYKDMSDKLLHPRGSAPAAATSVKPAGRKEDPIEVSPVAQSNNPFSVFRHQSAKPLPNSNAASQHARPVPVSALVSKSLKITFAGTTTRVNEKQQPQRQGSPAVPVSLSDDSPKSSPSQALSKGKVSSSSNLGNAKKDANMHGKQKQRKVVLEGSDEESSDSDFDYRAKKQLGKRTAEKSADACTIESISLGDSPAAIPLRPPHTTATTAVDTGLEASPFVLTAKRRAKGPSGQGAVLEIADSDDDDEGRPTHGPSKGAARAGVALASNPATKPRQKRAYQMIDDEEPDDDDDDDDSTSSDSDAVVAAPRSAMAKVRLARGGGGGPGPPVDLLDDSSGGDDEDEDDVSIMGMGSLASNPAQAPRRRMARLGAARDDSNGGAAAAMGVKRLVKLRKAVNGGGGSENGSGSGAGSGSVAAIAVASSSEDKVDVSSASSSEGEGSDVEVSDGGHGREDSEGSVFDPLDIAMRKCEAIAFSLRKALGLHEEEEEGFRGCSELPPAAALVPASEMAEVCGGWHKTKPLKVYQLVGVNFMLLLHRNQVGGAILADEMGLGKTVQAISFMGMVHARDPRCGPFLVVAPASLLENWQRELSQWCPGLRVVLYHGGRRAELQDTLLRAHRRGDMADGDRSTRPFDVMLTCYSLFERDSQVSKDDRALLRKWRWSYMVLDEAHMLKDRNSMRWRKLSQVSAHARGRLMLTGTPLQNRAEELWHMLEFLLPETFAAAGRVDLSSIIEHFAKQSAPLAPPSAPLQKPSNPGPDGPSANGTLRRSAAGGKGETKAENLGGELLGGDPESSTDPFVQRMKKMLAPFVLRRTKADVMRELTPKTHVVEDVELLPGQREVYEGAVCTHLRARREGAALAANNIFTHLRKIANHPLLVRHLYDNDKVAEIARICFRRGIFGGNATEAKVLQEVAGYNDFTINQMCKEYARNGLGPFILDESCVMDSGKVQSLAKLLFDLKAKGSRPLIFSQWTSVLDILEEVLQGLSLSYLRLDGQTQVGERLELTDAFNRSDEHFAFLLTTRAGGQGLNLVGADTVILHDVDFNPHVDRQAEDRAHRIGQTRPVTVYRLVAKDTVDEGVLRVANKKLHLDAVLLAKDKDGRKDMEHILSMLLAGKPMSEL